MTPQPATKESTVRITIRCEECGRRHRVERLVGVGQEVYIVCHSCEVTLRAKADIP